MWMKADIRNKYQCQASYYCKVQSFSKKKKQLAFMFLNIWPQKLKSELAIYYTVALIAKFFFLQEFQNI